MKKVYSTPSLCIEQIYQSDILTMSVDSLGDTNVTFMTEWFKGGGF